MFYKNKVFLGLRPATLLKKRLWHWCFPVNSAKFRRTLFFYRTPLNGRLVTEFPQTRGPSLTAIHPINTAGLFNYNAYKKLQVVRRYHHFPVILITLSSIFSHTFQAQTLPNTPLLVANLLHVQWTLSKRKKIFGIPIQRPGYHLSS